MIKVRSYLKVMLCGLLLAGPGAGLAVEEPPEAPVWDQLDEAERVMLRPLRNEWDTLSAERRVRLQRGARLWQEMTDEQRLAAGQRLQEWKSMPVERQQRILSLFQRFKALPVTVQERLRNRHRWYQSLPKAQQQSLRTEWETQRSLLQERGGLKTPLGRAQGGSDEGDTREGLEQRMRNPAMVSPGEGVEWAPDASASEADTEAASHAVFFGDDHGLEGDSSPLDPGFDGGHQDPGMFGPGGAGNH